MTGARDKVLALIDDPEAFALPDDEVVPLQLAAAQECLARDRTRVPLLDQRAREAAIDEIDSLHDVVPLLFSHTAYKSYPASFLTNGRWDRLLLWYGTLATEDVTTTDLRGVETVDDFIERLWNAAHYAYTTSGTSGKCSFLDNSAADRARMARILASTQGWPRPIRQGADMHYFCLGPSSGPYRSIDAARAHIELFSSPAKARFLSDEPMRVTQILRATEMRERMRAGTVAPEELAAFEADASQRTARMHENACRLAEDIVRHRHEPMIVAGHWAEHWAIVERAREMGAADGGFHPDSCILPGGGVKGTRLPADHREQIAAFYAGAHVARGYSMSEMDSKFPLCEAGRYHRPPWVLMLVLDTAGEELAEPSDGILDGRFAFLMLGSEGRWGGLITGDRVQVDCSPVCPCGRPGPTILDTVSRYGEHEGGDDKIGCAGAIDAYMRGIVGE